MIVYFSGAPGGKNVSPEIMAHDHANLMLTFWDMKEKPSKRFKKILKQRKKRWKRTQKKNKPAHKLESKAVAN